MTKNKLIFSTEYLDYLIDRTVSNVLFHKPFMLTIQMLAKEASAHLLKFYKEETGLETDHAMVARHLHTSVPWIRDIVVTIVAFQGVGKDTQAIDILEQKLSDRLNDWNKAWSEDNMFLLRDILIDAAKSKIDPSYLQVPITPCVLSIQSDDFFERVALCEEIVKHKENNNTNPVTEVVAAVAIVGDQLQEEI